MEIMFFCDEKVLLVVLEIVELFFLLVFISNVRVFLVVLLWGLCLLGFD